MTKYSKNQCGFCRRRSRSIRLIANLEDVGDGKGRSSGGDDGESSASTAGRQDTPVQDTPVQPAASETRIVSFGGDDELVQKLLACADAKEKEASTIMN